MQFSIFYCSITLITFVMLLLGTLHFRIFDLNLFGGTIPIITTEWIFFFRKNGERKERGTTNEWNENFPNDTLNSRNKISTNIFVGQWRHLKLIVNTGAECMRAAVSFTLHSQTFSKWHPFRFNIDFNSFLLLWFARISSTEKMAGNWRL